MPGRGLDHLPPFSSEVKERVDLNVYSPSRSLWPVQGRNLYLPLNLLARVPIMSTNPLKTSNIFLMRQFVIFNMRHRMVLHAIKKSQ